MIISVQTLSAVLFMKVIFEVFHGIFAYNPFLILLKKNNEKVILVQFKPFNSKTLVATKTTLLVYLCLD